MPQLSTPEPDLPSSFRDRRFMSTLVFLSWAGIPLIFSPPGWYVIAVAAAIGLYHGFYRRLPRVAKEPPFDLRKPTQKWLGMVAIAFVTITVYVGAMAWYHRMTGQSLTAGAFESMPSAIGYAIIAFVITHVDVDKFKKKGHSDSRSLASTSEESGTPS